jgi:hypothetical protein
METDICEEGYMRKPNLIEWANRTKPEPSLEDAIKIACTYHAVPTNTA